MSDEVGYVKNHSRHGQLSLFVLLSSFNPTATQEPVAIVADHGLSRRDAKTRFVKSDGQPIIRQSVRERGNGLFPATDLALDGAHDLSPVPVLASDRAHEVIRND